MPITEEFVKHLMEQNSILLAQNAAMAEQISQLTKTVEELNQTIKQLQERLNKNSKNSSKPPSSDGFNKPNANKDRSLRQSSGRKQGAQEGHEGKNLSVTSDPDHVEKHMHPNCSLCPHHDSCLEHACVKETRHEIDTVVKTTVTEHDLILVKECPLHGGSMQGTFPDHVRATVQYGPNLQALAVALNTVGAVSINRTHEILSSVFNIPLATGTIKNMVSRVADSLSGTYERIRQRTILSDLIHCDETGTRVDGKTLWVHDASNADYTFLSIHKKRGWAGMNDAGVLPSYQGIIVHDCWGSYWKYENVTHSICCAHLLRELNGVEENHPEQTWAPRFKELLLTMKKAKETALAGGIDFVSIEQLERFDKQYDEIIKTAYAENPLPETTDKKRGRKKKGKVLNLIGRLDKYKAAVCLFIKDFRVPFDNNQAERDIRMIKVKTKVSGCFRSVEGAQEYLTIMSYIGTARKHGMNPYEAIRSAISGTPDVIFN